MSMQEQNQDRTSRPASNSGPASSKNTTMSPNPTADPNPFPNLRRRRRQGLRMATGAAVALGLAVGGAAAAGATTTSTPSTSSAGAPAAGQMDTPPTAMGTVASIGTDTFTLTTRDGTSVIVNVGSTTTYLDPGVSSATLANVKVGAHVAVFGAEAGKTVSATKVAIGGPGGPGGPGGFPKPGSSSGSTSSSGSGAYRGPGPGGSPPAAVGTVASVGSNTFTITSRDGTKVTVNVTSSTTYSEFGTGAATIADVKVGTQVAVFGTDSSNTVSATKVGIGGPMGGAGGPGGPGKPGSAAASGSSASSGSNTSATGSSATT